MESNQTPSSGTILRLTWERARPGLCHLARSRFRPWQPTLTIGPGIRGGRVLCWWVVLAPVQLAAERWWCELLLDGVECGRLSLSLSLWYGSVSQWETETWTEEGDWLWR